jgi:hypothetical protein
MSTLVLRDLPEGLSDSFVCLVYELHCMVLAPLQILWMRTESGLWSRRYACLCTAATFIQGLGSMALLKAAQNFVQS